MIYFILYYFTCVNEIAYLVGNAAHGLNFSTCSSFRRERPVLSTLNIHVGT